MSTAPAPGIDPFAKQLKLLHEWNKMLTTLTWGHFNAAKYYGSMNQRFGVPVVIVTSIVGSAVFASIGSTDLKPIQIGAGLLSLAATVLASLQTFLGYGNRATAHKEAAGKYEDLREDVRLLQARDLTKITDLDAKLEAIKQRLCALDKDAPTIPPKIYEEAQKKSEH